MRNDYKQLLSVQFTHTFYTAPAKCADFALVPTVETQLLLRRQQCIYRETDDGGVVMYRTNDSVTAPLLPFLPGACLDFFIVMDNPVLVNYTTLTELAPVGQIRMYTNYTRTKNPDTTLPLKNELVLPATNPIIHKIVSNLDVVIELTSIDGRKLASVKYKAGSKDREHQFDFPGLVTGRYLVSEIVGATTTIYPYYLEPEMRGKSIFGLLRIENNPAYPFAYDGKDAYKISFTAASSTWKYYVVMPKDAVVTQYDIVDESTGPNKNRYSPARAGPILFTRKTIPATDKVAPGLESDTKKVVYYESNFPITWNQKVRPNLRLYRTEIIGATTKKTLIIANMPNPDTRKPGTNMLAFI
jgi:hypothetical protein